MPVFPLSEEIVMDYFASLVGEDVPSAVAGLLRREGRLNTLAHSQSVAEQACVLARRFGCDEDRAALAAICHDVAAVVPFEESVAVAQRLGLEADPTEREVPVLLHGAIGAAVLQQKLGVTDAEVLDAIRYHSTSRNGAGALERVIFVADKIALDPNSPAHGLVPAVQAAADCSLEKAAFVYLDWVMTCGPQLGWTIHPRVLKAHAELLSSGYSVAVSRR